jgi:membrane associated rhomboid family serine protease
VFFFLPIGDIAPRRHPPYVNYALIVANVLVFLLVGLRPDYDAIVKTYGLTPAHLQWVTFLTSTFLHGDFLHLGGNMLFLWIVGDNVEDVLGHLGYLAFYLLGGVLAEVPQVLLFPSSTIPGIGASGAISAVMAAYAVWFARNRIKVWYLVFLFPFIRSGVALVPAVVAIGLWFLGQMLYGLLVLGQPMHGGVGYWVHVGGFLFGLAVAVLVRLSWPGRIPRVDHTVSLEGRHYFRPHRRMRGSEWGSSS